MYAIILSLASHKAQVIGCVPIAWRLEFPRSGKWSIRQRIDRSPNSLSGANAEPGLLPVAFRNRKLLLPFGAIKNVTPEGGMRSDGVLQCDGGGGVLQCVMSRL